MVDEAADPLAAVNFPMLFTKRLSEGVECFVSGDLEDGKSIPARFHQATVGHAQLARVTGIPEKSLSHMFLE